MSNSLNIFDMSKTSRLLNMSDKKISYVQNSMEIDPVVGFLKERGKVSKKVDSFIGFYEDNKKILSSLLSVLQYLKRQAEKDEELKVKLDKASNQGQKWLALCMRMAMLEIDKDNTLATPEEFSEALDSGGVRLNKLISSFTLKEEYDWIEKEVLRYKWSKELFLDFMHGIDVTEPELLKQDDGFKERILLHMLAQGPAYALSCAMVDIQVKRYKQLSQKLEAVKIKSERKTARLNEDNKKQKEEIAKLQKKLGKKSQNTEDTAAESKKQIKQDYERLIGSLEAGFNQERKELLREIETLKSKNNRLKTELGRYEQYQDDDVKEENRPEIDLTKYQVLFMGGHINLVNKLKDKYPLWHFEHDDTLGEPLPKQADFLVYFTSHCSHGVFYRVQTWNKARKRPIVYVYANNLEQIESTIKEFIYNDQPILLNRMMY